MRVYSYSNCLVIFCTANCSRVLARERWQTFGNSREKNTIFNEHPVVTDSVFLKLPDLVLKDKCCRVQRVLDESWTCTGKSIAIKMWRISITDLVPHSLFRFVTSCFKCWCITIHIQDVLKKSVVTCQKILQMQPLLQAWGTKWVRMGGNNGEWGERSVKERPNLPEEGIYKRKLVRS